MKYTILAILFCASCFAQVTLQPINGTDLFPAARGKINNNFNALGSAIPTNTSQITESGNLYFTGARAISAMSGLYQSPITNYSTISGLSGYPSTWTPPMASLTILGGIKVGANLSIDGSGVLSSTASTGGTVTNILGPLTANYLMMGNGGNDSGVSPGFFDSSSVLNSPNGYKGGTTNTGGSVWSGVTSGAAGIGVNDVAGTAIMYLLPSTNTTANQFFRDSGTVTCPTFAAGFPTTCHQLVGAAALTAIPNPTSATLGGVESIDCTSVVGHIVAISTSGVPSCTADAGATVGTINFWQISSFSSSAGQTFTANRTYVFGFTLPAQITSAVGILVKTVAVDNTANLYDIGLYNSGGTLVASTGAVAGSTLFGSSAGLVNMPFTVATTLPSGTYYWAVTTNCSGSCATFTTIVSALGTPYSTASGNATTGGALNGSITATTSWTSISNTHWFLIYK
jgi:hypothetical protein